MAKGRVKGMENVNEADFVEAYIAGDSYEAIGKSFADKDAGRPNGLKADTVMNRAANIRKRLLQDESLTDAQRATITEKLAPKRKERATVGVAAAEVLGL